MVDSETTEIRALQCRQRGSWGGWLRRPSARRLRDERPNQNDFTSLAAARQIIEVCDYSLVRSHSSLGRLSLAKHATV